MNLLSVTKLTKRIADRVLFEEISFGINDRERIAITGRNGSGKSTLLKILAGLEEGDSGSVTRNNELSLQYLEQSPEFPDDATVADVIRLATESYEGEHAEEFGRNMLSILDEFKITPQMRTGDLSGGMHKKIAIARVFASPFNLLLLDEPTNHLDLETILWLQRRLEKNKSALLLVTHDRYFLDALTDTIFEISSGTINRYNGNYSYYVEKKAEAAEWEIERERKTKRFLKKELEWLKRQPSARGTKQKARSDRIDEVLSRKKIDNPLVFEFSVSGRRLGKKILEIKNIGKSFDDRTVIDGFSHVFKGNERIGIIGPNGSGKSTLLNLISGRLESDTGDIIRGQNTLIGYFDQRNVDFDPAQKAIDHVKQNAGQKIETSGGVITAAEMMEQFGFDSRMQYTPIARLSGGEKRRLNLINVLMKNPNFLIFDEPTNDLDIETLTVLEDFLDSFPGCVLIVSHDRYFLDRCVDSLFVFDGNGGIDGFPGNYSDFIAVQKERPAEDEKKTREPKQNKERIRTKTKLTFREKRELDDLETAIDRLDGEKGELIDEMASNPDYSRLQEIGERLKRIESELESSMQRWEELSAYENP